MDRAVIDNIMPERLKSEYPLGHTSIGSNITSWMGHAINPKTPELYTPIGTLYYMFWANNFAASHNHKHTAIIVDLPLSYDGLDAKTIKSKGDEKRKLLRNIASKFKLGNVEVEDWSLFHQECIEDIFNRYFAGIKDFIAVNPQFRENLLNSCIPEAYRKNPHALNYVVEEMASTLTMAELGSPMRIGHLLEKKLDRIVADYIAKSGMLISEKPSALYLQGDYTLEPIDKNHVLPPSKERHPKSRVLLTDSSTQLSYKISHASKAYRAWLKSILSLSGVDTGDVTADNLAEQVYIHLLEPLQKG